MGSRRFLTALAMVSLVSECASAAEPAGEVADASAPTSLSADRESPPPSASEPTSPPYVRRLGRTVGDQGEGYAERSVGLRGAFSGSSDGASVALLERGVGWLAGDVLSARYEDELFLGHSERDIVYRAALQAAMGARWSFPSRGGPFVRAGLRAGIEQDGGIRLATLQLPLLEVGYQFVRSGRVVDLAVSAAPLVAGYFQTADVEASLGGGAYGASTAIVLAPALFALDAALLPAGDAGFVADGRARLCALGNFGGPTATHRTGDPRRPLVVGPEAKDAGISLCASGRVTSFAALGGFDGRGSPLFGAALTLSFGAHSLLDRAP